MRTLIIILAIKLCITLCSCAGVTRRTEILLLETGDGKHKLLNELFRKSLGNYQCIYFNDYPNVVENDANLTTILQEYSSFKLIRDPVIVVHLYVKDFYKHNYNDISKYNFAYAGDGIEEINETVNKCSTKKYATNQTECGKKHDKCKTEEECLIVETTHSAKIVSDNVLDFPLLYDHIKNFTGTEPVQLLHSTQSIELNKNIIVCETNDFITEKNTHNLNYCACEEFCNFNIEYKGNCDEINIDSSTVAILAPKPFNVLDTIFPTTIFYDDHNSLPELEYMFKNSFHWMPMIKTKFALLKFLKIYEWNRVAIISDDSPTSQQLEVNIREMFDKENIIYASRSCDVIKCNYTELLKPFIAAKATVIIANVGEEHAMELAEQVGRMQSHRIAWVVTAWSEDVAKNAVSMGMRDIFSIHYDLNGYSDYNRKDILIDYIRRFLAPLDWFNDDYYAEQPKTYHKKIANVIKDVLYEKASLKFNIIWYRNHEATSIVSMTLSSANHVQLNLKKKLDISTHLDCKFKSDVFMKPCNDEEFMFFILVASVFILMVVGILYFFQSAEITYSRMPC